MHPLRSAIKSISLLALLLAIASPAQAAKNKWPKINCMPLEQLDPKIRYCTENVVAVEAATACSQKMMQAWDEAARELKLLQADEQSGQRVDYNRSRKKYLGTINRMSHLTRMLMRNADLIARYPSVMADIQKLNGLEESLPCYRDNFERIQQIVLEIDDKSHEAIAAVEATETLHRSVISRAGGIESKGSNRPAARAQVTGRVPASSKQKQRTSKITGELKNERLD